MHETGSNIELFFNNFCCHPFNPQLGLISEYVKQLFHKIINICNSISGMQYGANFRTEKNLAFLLIFLLCLFIIPTASAVSISVSPNTVQKGDKVMVHMSDIKDGSKFSLLVEGRFDVPPGAKFSFETNNFNMPISLSDGAISAYTENTQSTRFAVKKGEQEVVYSNLSLIHI